MKLKISIVIASFLFIVGCGGGGSGHYDDYEKNHVKLNSKNSPAIISTSIESILDSSVNLNDMSDYTKYSLQSKKNYSDPILEISKRYFNKRSNIQRRDYDYKESLSQVCKDGGKVNIVTSNEKISIQYDNCKEYNNYIDGTIDMYLEENGFSTTTNYFVVENNLLSLHYKYYKATVECSNDTYCEIFDHLNFQFTASMEIYSDDFNIVKGQYIYDDIKVNMIYREDKYLETSIDGYLSNPCTQNRLVELKTIEPIKVDLYEDDDCPIDGKIEFIGYESSALFTINDDKSIDIKIGSENLHYNDCNELSSNNCM